MKKNKYTVKVRKELIKINKTLHKSLLTYQLEGTDELVQQWKEGNLSAVNALMEIHKLLASDKNYEFIEGGDPGVSIAQAISDGVISHDQLSQDAQEAVKPLITMLRATVDV